MKATLKTKPMLEAAHFALSCLKTRTTLPILGHLLVEPMGGNLKFTGSDLETFVSGWCPAEISDPESFCVPAKLLVDTLSASPAEDVSIETLEKSKIRITLGNRKHVLSVMPAGEFPSVPQISSNPVLMSAGRLAWALSKILFAVGTDHQRVSITGIQWLFSDTNLKLTATSGILLGSVTLPIAGEVEFIATKHSMESTLMAASKSSGSVLFHKTEKAIRFEFDRFSVQASLIDAQYPHWARLVPESKISVETKRKELISAIKCAKIYQSPSPIYFGVKMKAKEGVLDVTYGTGENSFEEKLECEHNAEYQCKINPDSMVSILSALESDTVKIEATDELSYIMMREENLLYVVVPLRGQD